MRDLIQYYFNNIGDTSEESAKNHALLASAVNSFFGSDEFYLIKYIVENMKTRKLAVGANHLCKDPAAEFYRMAGAQSVLDKLKEIVESYEFRKEALEAEIKENLEQEKFLERSGSDDTSDANSLSG